MKRCAIVLAIICSLGWFPLSAQGATPAKSGVPAPPRQTAISLRVPDSTFAPATITKSFELSTASADNTSYWPRDWHSANYAAFGRVDGYLQEATWQPTGSTDTITFDYVSSIFASTDGATKDWQDGSTYYLKYGNVSSATCPGGIDARCARLAEKAVASNSNVGSWHDFIQYGQCLVETRSWAPGATFQSNQSQIDSTLAAIDRAGLDAMKTGCTQAAPTPTATPVPPTLTPTPRPKTKPTPKPTPKPPQAPPKAVAIRFDWLAATDGASHSSSTFRVRQDVKIVAAFTVSNLRPGKFVTVTASRVLEVPVLGGYSRRLSNHESMAITSNGQHQSVDDTGGFTVPGRFPFVVQISLGRTNLQRHVDFQVR